ncbi:MAG: hypothetical protein Q4C70_00700 [Planctomycetia bacterium]|nr:hypothetical protein [Planctomycetia bacterium]
MLKKGFLILSLLLISFLSGCGGEKLTTVTGNVSWKGEPVVEGRMEFAPVDGKTASVAGIIENGVYTVNVPPGEKIVRIFAYKKKGTRMIDDGMGNMVPQDLLEQVMPPKMNANSDIRVTIDGKQMEYNPGDLP